jgi:hypothetical protein
MIGITGICHQASCDSGFFMLLVSKWQKHTYYDNKKQENTRMNNYYEQMQNDQFPVAMAYVPWQKLDKLYEDLEDAFREGTIFPELNKPFCGRRCVK